MGNERLTLTGFAQAELIEKKSRFIAFAFVAESEEEALRRIQETRTRYRDATHVVYAYQIGPNDEWQRASDDGEPSGTAGRPVLAAVKKENLQNALLIVVRYFGGTLLGAGGLTRAYGKAAKMAIDRAGISKRIPAMALSIMVEYSLWGTVEAFLQQNGYVCRNLQFTDQVSGICLVPAALVAEFVAKIAQLTNARAKVIDLGLADFILQKAE